MPEYYLGLMSGTSVDGIDAALVDLSGVFPILVKARPFNWPDALRRRILETIEGQAPLSLLQLGQLDAAIGEQFAEAALALIRTAGVPGDAVKAIGSHGQTLFHSPLGELPFSMQSGDASRITEITGITTVADFRRRDIAAGGQGAPLVPAFHQAVFKDPARFRAILNVGGMANLTLLPAQDEPATGFDTGPGNVLLDAWHLKHRQSAFDKDGAWAQSGALNQPLLEHLLAHPYFVQAPPKSTGRETFCLSWLEEILRPRFLALQAADVQRTLIELTARSVSNALDRFARNVEQVLVCGGGAHNRFLMQRIGALLPHCQVDTTDHHGLHPDWVEAVAFAWLAKQTLEGKPGNLPAVTGARHAVILGAIHPA